MRSFRAFSFKDTNLRVGGDRFDATVEAIVQGRKALERYILAHSEFRSSFSPVVLRTEAPEEAHQMARAAKLTGLGPMASVAGTLAQRGVEAALAAGATEAIVENGGDMFMVLSREIVVGVWAGSSALAGRLAFRITPEQTPLALCSSSGRMGHSTSLGDCDLATVVSRDGALADSAATLVCNLVTGEDDLQSALETVGRIAGVEGILVVQGAHVGMIGNLPTLVRNADVAIESKVTRDRRSV
jgi:hypothetical protein